GDRYYRRRAAARGQDRRRRRRQGRSRRPARARRRHRRRHRKSQDPSRRGARARSRRFRELRGRASRDRRPLRHRRAGRGNRRGAQRAPHEGIPAGVGQAHASPGAGGRPTRQPLLRPAVGAVRTAQREPRRHRAQGSRSRGRREVARRIEMHLLQTSSTTFDDLVAPVDLGQPPGDILVLSFADSDLAALAAAYAADKRALPSLRLAHLRDLRHPMSVDLWIDKSARHAKVIVVRLLGGLDWWRYGVEALGAAARAHGITLAVLPGEDRDDARLAEASTLPPEELAALLAYFRAGGCENLRALLRRLAAYAGASLPVPKLAPLARMGGYLPPLGAISLDRLHAECAQGRPAVPILFYRSALLAADTAPIDALCEALAARGLAPAPLFVPSLKEEEAARFVREALSRLEPAVVVTATAFAVGAEDGASVFDAADAPVVQAIIATTRRAASPRSAAGPSRTGSRSSPTASRLGRGCGRCRAARSASPS